MSKRFGGNVIGCKDKTSSWNLIAFPDDGSNRGSTVPCRGGSPVVMYTHYINRHAGTQSKTNTKNTMSLDSAQFCYIGSRIGWVSAQLYNITILLAMSKLQIDKAGDKVLLSDNCQVNLTTITRC